MEVNVPEDDPIEKDDADLIITKADSNDETCPAPQDGLIGPQRLHPSSILFGVLKYVRQFIVAFFFAIFLASSGNRIGAWFAAAALLPATIKSVFDYFFLRFEIVDGELRVHEGWLFRRDRAVPIERIQNLDLIQNPLHRLIGVAGVRVETASGKEPEAVLNVLRLADIDRLRTSLFGTDGRSQTAAEDPANSIPTGEDVAVESTAPHDPVLLRASLSQLALYGMLSLRGLLAVPVIIGTYYQFQPDEWFDVRALRRFYPDASMLSFSWLVAIALAIGGLLLIGIASAIWFVARFYGYQLRRNGEDLQVSFGLITKVSATVPRGRIQFISVQQNLWARWLGLANIRIETAGGSTGEGVDPAASVARRWFIPVVSVSEIPRLLNELRDDLGQQWVETPWQSTSPRTLRRLLFVAALESALVTLVLCFFSWFWGVLVGLAVFLLLAFRSYRYSNSLRIYCGDGRVAYRQGLWTKRSSVTFADKLQTARLQQSLFDRRWGMASLAIDTAGAGPAEHRIHIVYLDQADASRMQRLISRGATEAGFSG